MDVIKAYTVAAALACAVLAALASLARVQPVWLEGLLFDGAVAARATWSPPARTPEGVAVVAVDRRSLDAPELVDTPRALFGPVWARLISALAAADARVVAFDLLLPYSGNRISPGYDQPFLEALNEAGSRVVLARSAEIVPNRAYLAALRFDPRAMGLIEMIPDADGVHRAVRTRFAVDGGGVLPSLVGEALSRAGIDAVPAEVMLAPAYHPERLPTYALIDVLRCAAADPQVLRDAFRGRMVFVGTTLPEEDRKASSARFIGAPRDAAGARSDCGLRRLPASAPESSTVPGVHLHAVAAQIASADAVIRPIDPAWMAAVAAAAALIGAAAGFLLWPAVAVGVAVLLSAALWGAEVVALGAGAWLSAANPILAVFGALVVAYVARFLFEDRRRRRIQRAFGHYLAPAVVQRLAESAQDPELGGSTRDVTIMFADLSGFTALSERLPADALMEATNAYLKLIADTVDATGGYVDKFIGDAVMAIWGAPADDPDHAVNAVAAALSITDRVRDEKARAEAAGRPTFDIKIGINSGAAVVGNVGSERRHNYTAVGEAVNVAARFESLPGVYGCRIVIASGTADRVRDRFLLRELDSVAVKGKVEPIVAYEPLAPRDGAPAAAEGLASAYEETLRLYRTGRFAEAAERWSAAASDDGPSRVMAERARAYATDPPGAGWDGIWRMATK